MQIYQIIDKIDDNQLFIPAFQREYVWKRSHTKALFTSLIKRYPTGTLLSWETTRAMFTLTKQADCNTLAYKEKTPCQRYQTTRFSKPASSYVP